MLKNLIKRLPIINIWHKNRRLSYDLKLASQQLSLAIEQIETLQLSNIKTNESIHKCGIEADSTVISLTSYGHRASLAHHTLLSLLSQTVKVEKIILWLSHEEFNNDNLPKNLKDCIELGVDIRFCDDIRSYKKLIPTLSLFPDANIITVDDDVVYPKDHIEKLLKTSKDFPDTIICHLAHRISHKQQGSFVDSNSTILPYNKWSYGVAQKAPGTDIFPVGIGGVLYPPRCFDSEVLNKSQFMSLCPHADDIWFKLMSLRNGTLAKVVDNPIPYRSYLHTPTTQQVSLWKINSSQNDIQLSAALSAYPEIRFG